jgi:hypothetical protein
VCGRDEVRERKVARIHLNYRPGRLGGQRSLAAPIRIYG